MIWFIYIYLNYLLWNTFLIIFNLIVIESTGHYRPRPGIVLDDTLDYTGTQGLPSQRPYGSSRHPSLHDVFDVTVSAIQGPGGSSGNFYVIACVHWIINLVNSLLIFAQCMEICASSTSSFNIRTV